MSTFDDIYREAHTPIREGGPRKNIPQQIRHDFINAICAIHDPYERKRTFDEILEEIKERNVKEYMKAHPSEDVTESDSPPLGTPQSETI
jgi:hypothetical protein